MKERLKKKDILVKCAAERTDVPRKEIDVLSFEDIENYF